MTTFQEIMPMISFVEFLWHYVLFFKWNHHLIKKSFAEITQRSANCSQFFRRGISFYFLEQFSSQFYPSSDNCYLFFWGEIIVYISLQWGLSWRDQVTRTFLKAVYCVRMSKIDSIITYLTKPWSLTMSRDVERKISVTELEPETKRCFASFPWS